MGFRELERGRVNLGGNMKKKMNSWRERGIEKSS